jgi:hypothetical protein
MTFSDFFQSANNITSLSRLFKAPFKKYLSPYDAALRLGIAQKTIWGWARDGAIETKKTNNKWQYKIEASPLGILNTYLLEFKDIEAIFSLPETAIKQWLKRKGLRGIKTGKLWRFAPADLFDYFSKNTGIIQNCINQQNDKYNVFDDEEDEYEESIDDMMRNYSSCWEEIVSRRKYEMKYGNMEKVRRQAETLLEMSGKVTSLSPIYIEGKKCKKQSGRFKSFHDRIKEPKFITNLTSINDEINKIVGMNGQISSDDLESFANRLLYADNNPTHHENHEEYPIPTDEKIKRIKENETFCYEVRRELGNEEEIPDEDFKYVSGKKNKVLYRKNLGFIESKDFQKVSLQNA